MITSDENEQDIGTTPSTCVSGNSAPICAENEILVFDTFMKVQWCRAAM